MENNKYQENLQLKLNLFQGKKITKIDASATNQWIFYFDDGTKLTIEAVNVYPSIGLIGLDIIEG